MDTTWEPDSPTGARFHGFPSTWEPDSPTFSKKDTPFSDYLDRRQESRELHCAGLCRNMTHDPELSASGCENATQIGKHFAEEPLVTFDMVVSSPYRRCIETAVLICKELHVPLAVDSRLGEIQSAAVMGDMCEDNEHLRQSLVENVAFAKACGVELIGMEDLCGTAVAPDDLPAYPENLPKAFKRYVNAFELFVSSGKSILCVTHGMALVSIKEANE